jgi:transposase InsO family protein
MFVGVVGYIREHIKGFADIVRPLNLMLNNYSKATARKRVLEWTDESNAAFDAMRTAVHECPMMWFLDDTSPIILYTDASDYGIGAYLCQVVDGQERPIGFLSKALQGAELDWSTPQKEGYAIFYALGKWEYLLRDRKFLIRTDHDNLLKLKQQDGRLQKVQRWFACYQMFDHTMEHWPGSRNIVADGWSRLVSLDALKPDDRLCVFDDEPCLDDVDVQAEVVIQAKVPKKLWKAIESCHNGLVGHHGIERTLGKLQASNHKWPLMRQHIGKFIKECPCCQKMSRIKIPIHAHPFILSRYRIGELVYMDFIENLVPDEWGYTHVLVLIDACSRWVELCPTKGNTSEQVAPALIDYFSRHGRCQLISIVSDNGKTLTSELITEVTKMLGLNHIKTIPYSKEENGMVERVNQEVERHLRNIIFDKEVLRQWSIYLPLVRRIINVSKHSALGISPAEMIYGHTIHLHSGFLYNHDSEEPGSTQLSSWAARMISVQTKILDDAAKQLKWKDDRHMKSAMAEYIPASYPIDSYVLVEHRENALRPGPTSKLLPFLKGPLKIVAIDGSRYTLECLLTSARSDHVISKLRPFYYDAITQDPLTYALRDDKESNTFEVLKVTNMRGDPKGSKKDIYLEVYWSGYAIPTWEPWANMRQTAQLHKYLAGHTSMVVRRMLPKGYNAAG